MVNFLECEAPELAPTVELGSLRKGATRVGEVSYQRGSFRRHLICGAVPSRVAKTSVLVVKACATPEGLLVSTGDHIRELGQLLRRPNETLAVEYKAWLNLKNSCERADLAKALMAVSNHGGGYVVLGYQDNNGILRPDPCRPSDLSAYNPKVVGDIIDRFAEPTFHCQVSHVAHPEFGSEFPIIQVPAGSVPIQARRSSPEGCGHVRQGVYYIRKPGPKSEPPGNAAEWSVLIRRCVTQDREVLLKSIANIIGATPTPQPATPPNERLRSWKSQCREQFEKDKAELGHALEPDPYRYGTYSCAYTLVGEVDPLTLTQFKDVLLQVQGKETGWPVWMMNVIKGHTPKNIGNVIRQWYHTEDTSHADYWLADPAGKLFLARGYQEDGEMPLNAGKYFDISLPIWRVAECLRHAARLAQRMLPTGGGEFEIEFEWDSLKGRKLISWAEQRHRAPSNVSAVPSVITSGRFNVEQVAASLGSIVRQLTLPLYEAFDFFQPTEAMYEEVLDLMLRSGPMS